eukprot:tig00021038_g17500.t2
MADSGPRPARTASDAKKREMIQLMARPSRGRAGATGAKEHRLRKGPDPVSAVCENLREEWATLSESERQRFLASEGAMPVDEMLGEIERRTGVDAQRARQVLDIALRASSSSSSSSSAAAAGAAGGDEAAEPMCPDPSSLLPLLSVSILGSCHELLNHYDGPPMSDRLNCRLSLDMDNDLELGWEPVPPFDPRLFREGEAEGTLASRARFSVECRASRGAFIFKSQAAFGSKDLVFVDQHGDRNQIDRSRVLSRTEYSFRIVANPLRHVCDAWSPLQADMPSGGRVVLSWRFTEQDLQGAFRGRISGRANGCPDRVVFDPSTGVVECGGFRPLEAPGPPAPAPAPAEEEDESPALIEADGEMYQGLLYQCHCIRFRFRADVILRAWGAPLALPPSGCPPACRYPNPCSLCQVSSDYSEPPRGGVPPHAGAPGPGPPRRAGPGGPSRLVAAAPAAAFAAAPGPPPPDPSLAVPAPFLLAGPPHGADSPDGARSLYGELAASGRDLARARARVCEAEGALAEAEADRIRAAVTESLKGIDLAMAVAVAQAQAQDRPPAPPPAQPARPAAEALQTDTGGAAQAGRDASALFHQPLVNDVPEETVNEELARRRLASALDPDYLFNLEVIPGRRVTWEGGRLPPPPGSGAGAEGEGSRPALPERRDAGAALWLAPAEEVVFSVHHRGPFWRPLDEEPPAVELSAQGSAARERERERSDPFVRAQSRRLSTMKRALAPVRDALATVLENWEHPSPPSPGPAFSPDLFLGLSASAAACEPVGPARAGSILFKAIMSLKAAGPMPSTPAEIGMRFLGMLAVMRINRPAWRAYYVLFLEWIDAQLSLGAALRRSHRARLRCFDVAAWRAQHRRSALAAALLVEGIWRERFLERFTAQANARREQLFRSLVAAAAAASEPATGGAASAKAAKAPPAPWRPGPRAVPRPVLLLVLVPRVAPPSPAVVAVLPPPRATPPPLPPAAATAPASASAAGEGGEDGHWLPVSKRPPRGRPTGDPTPQPASPRPVPPRPLPPRRPPCPRETGRFCRPRRSRRPAPIPLSAPGARARVRRPAVAAGGPYGPRPREAAPVAPSAPQPPPGFPPAPVRTASPPAAPVAPLSPRSAARAEALAEELRAIRTEKRALRARVQELEEAEQAAGAAASERAADVAAEAARLRREAAAARAARAEAAAGEARAQAAAQAAEQRAAAAGRAAEAARAAKVEAEAALARAPGAEEAARLQKELAAEGARLAAARADVASLRRLKGALQGDAATLESMGTPELHDLLSALVARVAALQPKDAAAKGKGKEAASSSGAGRPSPPAGPAPSASSPSAAAQPPTPAAGGRAGAAAPQAAPPRGQAPAHGPQAAPRREDSRKGKGTPPPPQAPRSSSSRRRRAPDPRGLSRGAPPRAGAASAAGSCGAGSAAAPAAPAPPLAGGSPSRGAPGDAPAQLPAPPAPPPPGAPAHSSPGPAVYVVPVSHPYMLPMPPYGYMPMPYGPVPLIPVGPPAHGQAPGTGAPTPPGQGDRPAGPGPAPASHAPVYYPYPPGHGGPPMHVPISAYPYGYGYVPGPQLPPPQLPPPPHVPASGPAGHAPPQGAVHPPYPPFPHYGGPGPVPHPHPPPPGLGPHPQYQYPAPFPQPPSGPGPYVVSMPYGPPPGHATSSSGPYPGPPLAPSGGDASHAQLQHQ